MLERSVNICVSEENFNNAEERTLSESNRIQANDTYFRKHSQVSFGLVVAITVSGIIFCVILAINNINKTMDYRQLTMPNYEDRMTRKELYSLGQWKRRTVT